MTAILSLASLQERQQWADFRRQAHDALDRCLDRCEALMTEPGSSAPTLMEITGALAEERAGLTSALVEAFVERRHGPLLTQQEAPCSKCERRLRAQASRSRTVETLLGPVRAL